MIRLVVRWMSLGLGCLVIVIGAGAVIGQAWHNPILALASPDDAYQYDLQTHVLQPLLPGGVLGDHRLGWSPDGRYLAINDTRQTRTLHIVERGSETLTKLHDFAGDFRWSPSGAWIAFMGLSPGGREVLIARPDGTHRRNLTRNSDRHELLGWAQADAAVIYLSRVGERHDIAQTALADGQTRRLFSVAAAFNVVRLSPDGTRVACVQRDDHGQHQLIVYTLAGAIQVALPAERSNALAWSPDGRRIALTQYNPTTGLIRDLWILDAQTGAMVQQTIFPAHTIQQVLWQRDSQGLLVVGAHHLNATSALFAVALGSQAITPLPFPREVRPTLLTWHPQ